MLDVNFCNQEVFQASEQRPELDSYQETPATTLSFPCPSCEDSHRGRLGMHHTSSGSRDTLFACEAQSPSKNQESAHCLRHSENRGLKHGLSGGLLPNTCRMVCALAIVALVFSFVRASNRCVRRFNLSEGHIHLKHH